MEKRGVEINDQDPGGSLMGSDHVLSKGNYRKFLGWLGREKLECFRCGKELVPGDEVHRCGQLRIKYNQLGDERENKFCRFYHAECFEELFIEC